MEVRAIARGIRVSPRKARLVCDAVRGKDIRGITAGCLRFYSRGSNASPFNDYVSVEVLGQSVDLLPRLPWRPGLMIWRTKFPPAPYL